MASVKAIKGLENEILQIKKRNARVEADKAWETSGMRKVLIFALTYFVVVALFFAMGTPNPLINALIPSVAFVLSTLSIPFFKAWWLKRVHRQ